MSLARQILRGVAIAVNLVGVMLYVWLLWRNGLTGTGYDYIQIAEIFIPAIAVLALFVSN